MVLLRMSTTSIMKKTNITKIFFFFHLGAENFYVLFFFFSNFNFQRRMRLVISSEFYMWQKIYWEDDLVLSPSDLRLVKMAGYPVLTRDGSHVSIGTLFIELLIILLEKWRSVPGERWQRGNAACFLFCHLPTSEEDKSQKAEFRTALMHIATVFFPVVR